MSVLPAPSTRFRTALALVLWVWFAAVLVVNLPGHLTHDSLVQISEGRSGYVNSWNPIFSSWVFGSLVSWTNGTEILVALSASMLAAALYLTLQACAAPRPWCLVPAAVLLFTPILLIHPGIVWKDVWFAHFALLGFGLIAWRSSGGGWIIEILALVCLAAALLSRQTGIVVSVVGALALSLTRHGSFMVTSAAGSGFRIALGFGWRIVAMMAVASTLSTVAQDSMKQIRIGEVGTGVKLVAFFDMAGMLQRLPEAKLSHLQSQGFDTTPWEVAARASYSGERIDRLDLRAFTGPGELTQAMILTQWLQLIAAHPVTYAAHRLDAFSWFSGLQNQTACIPVHVGVDVGPHTPTAGLTLRSPRWSPVLYQWSRNFVDSPYFAPLFWNAVSVLILLAYAWRGHWREPVAWLQVAGLLYSLSYLIAGLSCDFRYSYFSVAAASIGLIRLCADGLLHARLPKDAVKAQGSA